MSRLLNQLIQETPYHSYLYAYPHKTAYREFEHPINLTSLWEQEDKSALSLYIHIPFCAMRCGFCNLFTLAQPRGDIAERYVAQLMNQMHVTADFLGEHRFAAFACGGGTPTFLEAEQLDYIFTSASKTFNLDMNSLSGGIETSPETATKDRLEVCKNFGFERISMGLQSFYAAEVQALARKQKWQDVDTAIHRIRQANFPILNLDLIYGIPGQNVQSFMDTLTAALRYAPEELYLYPLYVRPLTGLNKIAHNAQQRSDNKSIELIEQHQQSLDLRLEMYTAARDLLLAQGYEQVSMRMFKLSQISMKHSNEKSMAHDYTCQNDGMIGLGCGARSYTQSLHYSEEYGIARSRISDILLDYCNRSARDFKTARYGYTLDLQEQQRRFIIQSLLLCEGLNFSDYHARFNSNPISDLPNLQELVEVEVQGHALATLTQTSLKLTATGIAYADAIGPWLISPEVKQRMQAYALR